MKRHVALLGCVTAVSALPSIGCGSRTGALDGFGSVGGSGTATGDDIGGESGAVAESGVAAASGASGATSGVSAASGSVGPSGTFSAGSGALAVSGTLAASGVSAASGSLAFSGTAFGGSGFAATADAGPPVGIPPVVAEGCDALCAKEATAMCPNQGSVASCVLGCRALLNNPSCTSQTEALFACERTSTVSCDSSGKASLDSCLVQTLSSAACFLQSTSDPALTGPCTKFCAESAAVKCPNDSPSSCQQSCMVVGNLIPACDPAWSAYVTCADSASFSCGSDGKAWAPACAFQALTYLACTAQGVTTVSDAGP
jgi:hypothetical protein